MASFGVFVGQPLWHLCRCQNAVLNMYVEWYILYKRESQVQYCDQKRDVIESVEKYLALSCFKLLRRRSTSDKIKKTLVVNTVYM